MFTGICACAAHMKIVFELINKRFANVMNIRIHNLCVYVFVSIPTIMFITQNENCEILSTCLPNGYIYFIIFILSIQHLFIWAVLLLNKCYKIHQMEMHLCNLIKNCKYKYSPRMKSSVCVCVCANVYIYIICRCTSLLFLLVKSNSIYAFAFINIIIYKNSMNFFCANKLILNASIHIDFEQH